MKDASDGVSRRELEGGKHRNGRARAFAAAFDPMPQGRWANLPPELLLDIIRRVEESEASWPARAVVVFCASVCRSWRDITKEIVKAPEECGRLTFPISLKQSGPRDAPIQCFIKRDRSTSTYRLYFGLSPSEVENDKLLLIAKKIRRAAGTDFVISLVADDFSRTSNAFVGKLRSNFLGTKFIIYDSQPPSDAACLLNNRPSRRVHPKQVPPKLPSYNYIVASVSYELNVLRTRGPRRMHCVVHSVPVSSTSCSHCMNEKPASFQVSKGKEPVSNVSSLPESKLKLLEALVLKNKAPRWHEQLQCWCLNFKGRVTVASVKNFQLVASVDPGLNIPSSEQEKVILQFGKIAKDIFTMDYRYPLSAFQAFAICLSSFDTKPVCE